jgi:hypothetical protein
MLCKHFWLLSAFDTWPVCTPVQMTGRWRLLGVGSAGSLLLAWPAD